MRAVVQRVIECSVTVEQRTTGRIERGLLVYLGVGRNDDDSDLRYMVDKVANLRVFEDDQGKMNRSLNDEGLPVLVVSQFTLYGDVRKGRRPSYGRAADPQDAERLYCAFIAGLSQIGVRTAAGEFGAKMQVTYTNAGPVTILLDSQKAF